MTTIWLTYDPEDGFEEHPSEAGGRGALDALLDHHRDQASDGVHEAVEAVALYRCERIASIRQTVTATAEDQTEAGAWCRDRGFDFKVELDVVDDPPTAAAGPSRAPRRRARSPGRPDAYRADDPRGGVVIRTVTLAEWDAAPDDRAWFWGPPDSEQLDHEDLDEAIEEYLDDAHPDRPDEIEVAGYARMAVGAGEWPDARDLVEHVLQNVDEEHGDPDGDGAAITEPMLAAAREFLAVVAAEYVPWACEEVVRVRVDVVAWLAARQPTACSHGAPEGEPCSDCVAAEAERAAGWQDAPDAFGADDPRGTP